MAIYRSALGKSVDMAALAAKNERTRAVGNMKVNARGDVIDSQGKIIKPMTAKVSETYGKTVGNRSAQPVRRPPQPAKPKAPVKPAVVEPLTEVEKELEDSWADDVEVEQIKAKEVGKS